VHEVGGRPMTMIEVDVGLENFDKVPKLPEPPPKRAAGPSWANPLFRPAVYSGGPVVVLAGASLLWHLRFPRRTDDAHVDGPLAPTSAKTSGNVIEVLVDDNQPVKAGQVLVRIDPRDYQARADQARAALMLAEAQAKAAQIGVPWTREVTQSGDSNA